MNTVRIFVMGKDPSSFKYVTLSNWDAKAFIGERQHISKVKERKELSQPGIYFLLRDNLENDFTDIYIGETDNFSSRLKRHHRKHEWWNKFVVFTSKSITKAHVKYLEKKIYDLAKESVGTLKLKNKTAPGETKLTESEISDMEKFLENMIFTLGALGLGYFASNETLEESGAIKIKEESSEFYETKIRINGKAYKASLQILGDRYILKKGSFIRNESQPSFNEYPYFTLWKQVVNSGDVSNTDIKGVVILKKDVEFKSPSAAGSVVKGRPTNGRKAWKRRRDGKKLKEVESQ